MPLLIKELIKHHSAGKRYTYYPPVSKWEAGNRPEIKFENKRPWSLYLHLPFCRELCTFCGCNIKVTKSEKDHIRYTDALIKEFRSLNFSKPEGPFTLIFGGGSPNALSFKALKNLSLFIQQELPSPDDSLCEIDPRSFTQAQADLFLELGFKRFSFGVQDFNEEVVANVNRKQSIDQLERTAKIIKERASFGIDLLWGMPLQENDPFKNWDQGLERLDPDWINFYPMAHVPWLDSVQKAYGDFILPDQQRKYELYVEGVKLFEQKGFVAIGMGHFLKKGGELHRHFLKKELHRSVSGLFLQDQSQLLALGVSAISISNSSMWQNEKIIDRYLMTIEQEKDPVIKVHEKNKQDKKMDHLINKVIKEDLKLTLDDTRFPDNWFETRNEKRVISAHGRHFKKNILQVLEKELDE
jgi:oxygen-independent coproporphyrinogen-3 oxidase